MLNNGGISSLGTSGFSYLYPSKKKKKNKTSKKVRIRSASSLSNNRWRETIRSIPLFHGPMVYVRPK